MNHCSKCGATLGDGSKFCSLCGTPAEATEQPAKSDNKPSLLSAFSGSLFLAICVLVSVSTALSFDLMHLLFTIFCWLIYVNARGDTLNTSMMRAVSGSVFACRIIYFAGAIILLLCAGIVCLCALIIPPEVVEELQAHYADIIAAIEQNGFPQYAIDAIGELLGNGIKKLLTFIAGTLAGLGAYLLALGFIWSGIHKFTKELHTKAAASISEFEHTDKGAFCMMISGIVMAVFAVFGSSISFSSTVPALLTAATMIVGSVFVKKNFK